MLSLEFKTNMSDVINLITERLENINLSELTALQASTVMAEMRKRIHVEGEDSSGAQIGVYTPAYIKLRTGNYSDSKTNKKGIKTSAGKFTERTIKLNKQTGVFKGEDKVGKERPKYHRSADPKVILSLTSQMENHMIIIPFKNGCGIGYSTEFDFNKSQWNERRYKKNIFNLTEKERELAITTGQEYINETLK